MKPEVFVKRQGLVDQFVYVCWKFYARRFGLYGNAIQTMGEIEVDAIKEKAKRQADKLYRKLTGKNGWLWFTAMRYMGRAHTAEERLDILDRRELMLVSSSLRRFLLRTFFPDYWNDRFPPKQWYDDLYD